MARGVLSWLATSSVVGHYLVYFFFYTQIRSQLNSLQAQDVLLAKQRSAPFVEFDQIRGASYRFMARVQCEFAIPSTNSVTDRDSISCLALLRLKALADNQVTSVAKKSSFEATAQTLGDECYTVQAGYERLIAQARDRRDLSQAARLLQALADLRQVSGRDVVFLNVFGIMNFNTFSMD